MNLSLYNKANIVFFVSVTSKTIIIINAMSVIQKQVFTMNCNVFLGNYYFHAIILSLPFVSVLLSDEKYVYMHIGKNIADT